MGYVQLDLYSRFAVPTNIEDKLGKLKIWTQSNHLW